MQGTKLLNLNYTETNSLGHLNDKMRHLKQHHTLQKSICIILWKILSICKFQITVL